METPVIFMRKKKHHEKYDSIFERYCVRTDQQKRSQQKQHGDFCFILKKQIRTHDEQQEKEKPRKPFFIQGENESA